MPDKDNEINVLHIISSLVVGGAEKLLVDLVKTFCEHNNNTNITVVVMNNIINEELKEQLLSTGCKVFFLNKPRRYKHPKYLFKLLDIVKNNKIDIIHTHNPGSKIWSVLCKLVRPKLKLVYTFHDSNIVKRMRKADIWIHKKFIDMNIAISDVILDDCTKESINKITKIHNGIDTKKFFCNRTFPDKNIEPLNIINVARITYYKKGQDILIKALKECKDRGIKFICNLVGGVYFYDAESYEYLTQLIADLNLENDVYFLKNRADVPELLKTSDLFILPSRYEGLPISLLEAMASELPVIASDIPGPVELIQHGKNGLVFKSENHMDLADKITELYYNRDKMSELAQNGLNFVQNFDISIMREKYYNLYVSLAGKDTPISNKRESE